MMLRPLMERYDSLLVTEGTSYRAAPGQLRRYDLLQVNRREPGCLPRLAVNALRSLKFLLAEQPDVVICTGALATVPLCLIAKLLQKKLVFIESFAKVTTPTLTGRLLYHFADRFYIQWPQLREHYPQAVYVGGIF